MVSSILSVLTHISPAVISNDIHLGYEAILIKNFQQNGPTHIILKIEKMIVRYHTFCFNSKIS